MSAAAAEPAPSVFIVGAGVVGTALAARLVRAGVTVIGPHGRQLPATVSTADVIVVAVSDERIPEVATRLVNERLLRPSQILLHTSGAHAAATILAAARPHVRAVGTWHPLLSFADARVAAEGSQGIAFGIEGDEQAKAAAQRLVRALGARSVVLDGASLPLYHAGAVLASNYVVALADVARRLLIAAGVPSDQALPALIPLLSSVVQNLETVGLPGALTGPVQRGDVSTVEQHRRALGARAPELLELYRLVGRDVLRLARERSTLDDATVERLQGLFEAFGPKN
jgi:predicted short-subunit dehydrogenase-like oxidoreductase (DUF2520 family)